jgi:hypothetical protein
MIICPEKNFIKILEKGGGKTFPFLSCRDDFFLKSSSNESILLFQISTNNSQIPTYKFIANKKLRMIKYFQNFSIEIFG